MPSPGSSVVARTPEFSADVLGGMPSVNRDQIRMLIIAGDLHIPCFGEEDAAVQGRGEGVRPAFASSQGDSRWYVQAALLT